MPIERAALLIGVQKTGGLPVLNAVAESVERMRVWAEAQPGMRDAEGNPRVTVLLDDPKNNKGVSGFEVHKAITELIKDDNIEQLIVYFSGHGANLNYHERWLLSAAPLDASAAIDLGKNVPLARNCGVPHVVIISDACRTPDASIRAQSVDGMPVFPNKGPATEPGCVDLFFASATGQPSLEVEDTANAGTYRAIYTEALLRALGGGAPTIVSTAKDGETSVGRIEVRPLRKHLRAQVPIDLKQAGVAPKITQTPDAIITSDPPAWLSQVSLPVVIAGPVSGIETKDAGRRGRPGPGRGAREEIVLTEVTRSVADVARSALEAVVHPGAARRGSQPRPAATDQLFTDMLARTAGAPGEQLPSDAGFRLEGGTIAGAVAAVPARSTVNAVEVSLTGAAANVLIVFGDGTGTLLPAIRGYVGSLKLDRGELANVTYSPYPGTTAHVMMQGSLAELQALRDVMATSARLGAFRLDIESDREQVIDRLRSVKGLDPTMAVYATHALHDMHRQNDIAEIGLFLRAGIGLSLFDVEMFSRKAGSSPAPVASDVFPAVPVLGQGWAGLEPYGVTLPPTLAQNHLWRHLKQSLWTHFDPTGVEIVSRAIQSGEIQ